MSISLKQGSYYSLEYPIRKDGGTVSTVNDAKWVLYKGGSAAMTKTLADGISFADSKLTVTIDDSDTVSMSGNYELEVWITDANNNAVFVTKGRVTIEPTRTRF